MRHRHFVWLEAARGFLVLAALAIGVCYFIFDPSWPQYLLFFMCACLGLQIAVNVFVSLYLRIRCNSLLSPTSPDGLPNDPTGDWLDEPPEAGDRVLALSQGLWNEQSSRD